MMPWLATFSASFVGAWFGSYLSARRQVPNAILAMRLAEAREEIRRLVAAMDGEGSQ